MLFVRKNILNTIMPKFKLSFKNKSYQIIQIINVLVEKDISLNIIYIIS